MQNRVGIFKAEEIADAMYIMQFNITKNGMQKDVK